MKRFLSLLIVLFVINAVTYAQSLKKYTIGQSGCNVYMFCNPGEFDRSYSEDSSIVYTGECKTTDPLTYGVICVQLKEPLSSLQDAEDLLVAYLDFLKKSFDISIAAGYGKGNMLNSDPSTRGVVDYWKGKDGAEWKIKGWSNGKAMGILYVFAPGKLNETQKVNAFLDGFRFPAN